MATKKSTKKQGAKKQSSKTSSRKKTASKKRGIELTRKQRIQIPPVIVGGGGSIRIWLRKPYRALYNTPQPPVPASKDYYDCFRIENNAGWIDVHDGHDPQTSIEVKDHGRHLTVFSEG